MKSKCPSAQISQSKKKGNDGSSSLSSGSKYRPFSVIANKTRLRYVALKEHPWFLSDCGYVTVSLLKFLNQKTFGYQTSEKVPTESILPISSRDEPLGNKLRSFYNIMSRKRNLFLILDVHALVCCMFGIDDYIFVALYYFRSSSRIDDSNHTPKETICRNWNT